MGENYVASFTIRDSSGKDLGELRYDGDVMWHGAGTPTALESILDKYERSSLEVLETKLILEYRTESAASAKLLERIIGLPIENHPSLHRFNQTDVHGWTQGDVAVLYTSLTNETYRGAILSCLGADGDKQIADALTYIDGLLNK